MTDNKSSSFLFVLGGADENSSRDSTYLFDCSNQSWMELPLKLPAKSLYHGAALLNGEIYIFGGSFRKNTYKLDMEEMKWARLADMTEKRENIQNSCVVYNGTTLVIGGRSGRNVLKTVEQYDPKLNTWTIMTEMQEPRQLAAATVINDKIYVCGGHDGQKNLDSVEYFDPASQSWHYLPLLPEICPRLAVLSDGNWLITIGGYKEKRVWQLDVEESEEKRSWQPLPTMIQCHEDHTASRIGEAIVVVGGMDINRFTTTTVEILEGGRWRKGPPLPVELRGFSSVVLPEKIATELFL